MTAEYNEAVVVVSAKDYMAMGHELEDKIKAAEEGLTKAVEEVDRVFCRVPIYGQQRVAFVTHLYGQVYEKALAATLKQRSLKIQEIFDEKLKEKNKVIDDYHVRSIKGLPWWWRSLREHFFGPYPEQGKHKDLSNFWLQRKDYLTASGEVRDFVVCNAMKKNMAEMLPEDFKFGFNFVERRLNSHEISSDEQLEELKHMVEAVTDIRLRSYRMYASDNTLTIARQLGWSQATIYKRVALQQIESAKELLKRFWTCERMGMTVEAAHIPVGIVNAAIKMNKSNLLREPDWKENRHEDCIYTDDQSRKTDVRFRDMSDVAKLLRLCSKADMQDSSST